MCPYPIDKQAYLFLSEMILTYHPVFVASNIEYNFFGSFTQQICTIEGGQDVMWGIPISIF